MLMKKYAIQNAIFRILVAVFEILFLENQRKLHQDSANIFLVSKSCADNRMRVLINANII